MTKKLYLGPGNRPRYSGGEAVLGGAVMGGGGGATVVIYGYIYQER